MSLNKTFLFVNNMKFISRLQQANSGFPAVPLSRIFSPPRRSWGPPKPFEMFDSNSKLMGHLTVARTPKTSKKGDARRVSNKRSSNVSWFLLTLRCENPWLSCERDCSKLSWNLGQQLPPTWREQLTRFWLKPWLLTSNFPHLQKKRKKKKKKKVFKWPHNSS